MVARKVVAGNVAARNVAAGNAEVGIEVAIPLVVVMVGPEQLCVFSVQNRRPIANVVDHAEGGVILKCRADQLRVLAHHLDVKRVVGRDWGGMQLLVVQCCMVVALCCPVLSCPVLCDAVLCFAALCFAVLCCAVLS